MFLINEWLWADISGSNGVRNQSVAAQFLEAFIYSSYQIVIVTGSAFDQKAWEHCRSLDTIGRRLAKLFVVQIRQNSSKALFVSLNDLGELTGDLRSLVKDDDHYLVRTLVMLPDVTLVTTDEPLRKVLADHVLKAISRDDFLESYFKIG